MPRRPAPARPPSWRATRSALVARCSTGSTSTSKYRVNYDKLSSERQGEPSSAVREHVTAARQKQAERFKNTRLLTNASGRAYHGVLKLARTIADLVGVADIGPTHLAEAIQYRPRRVE